MGITIEHTRCRAPTDDVRNMEKQLMTNQDLMSVEEGSKFTHLRESTLRAWILQRRIPFVKLGRRVFLRRSDLEKLIEQSIVPARVRQ